MRFTSTLIALLCFSSSSGFSHPAFSKRGGGSSNAFQLNSAVSSVVEVDTAPIAGMKPGTSGLRKKVEVWQGVDEENKYYVENFIQSLIDTAKASNNGEQLDT